MSSFDLEAWLWEARELHGQVIRSNEAAGLVFRGGGAFILPAVDIAGGIRTQEIDWWPDRAKTPTELDAAIVRSWNRWEGMIRDEVARHPTPQDGVRAFFARRFDGAAPTTIEGLRSLTTDVIGTHGQMPSWQYTIVQNRARLRRGLQVMTGSPIGAIATGVAAHIRGGWHPTPEDWEAAYPVGELAETASNLIAPRSRAGTPASRSTVRPPSGAPVAAQQATSNRGTTTRAATRDRPRPAERPSPAAKRPQAATTLAEPESIATRASAAPAVRMPAPGRPTTSAPSGRSRARAANAPRISGFRTGPVQQRVLGKILGRPMDQTAPRPVGSTASGAHRAELASAESSAASLLRRIRDHWDAATPRRQTARQRAGVVLADVQRTRPADPNEAVRKKFFDQWRKRAMNRIARDRSLVADLKEQAGLVVAWNPITRTKSFRLRARSAEGQNVQVWVDIDHAIVAHRDAVRDALATGDASGLLSTVSANNLQLLTAGENRAVIEQLRRDATRWTDE